MPAPKDTVAIKSVIVNSLSAGLSLETARKAAGVSKRWIYYAMSKDPAFKEKCEQSKALMVSALAQEAHRRVFQQGSDKLLMWLLERETDEFKNSPSLNEAELQVLERITQLMMQQGLLPYNPDSLLDASYTVLENTTTNEEEEQEETTEELLPPTDSGTSKQEDLQSEETEQGDELT